MIKNRIDNWFWVAMWFATVMNSFSFQLCKVIAITFIFTKDIKKQCKKVWKKNTDKWEQSWKSDNLSFEEWEKCQIGNLEILKTDTLLRFFKCTQCLVFFKKCFRNFFFE